MPTLHWFHSLGIAGRNANYFLTESLAKRLRDVFPDAKPSDPAGAERVKVATASSGTAGLLSLLGPPGPGWTVRLHRIDTKKLRSCEKGVSAVKELAEQVPKWGDALEGTDLQYSTLLKRREPGEVARLIGKIIKVSQSMAVGDAVFFEATSGLRPIQMALTLSAELQALTKPGVRMLGASYAELAAPGLDRPVDRLEPVGRVAEFDLRRPAPSEQPPAAGAEAPLSPIYDLTELLALPRWATAGADLRDGLETRRLAELLAEVGLAEGEQARHLKEFEQSLRLAWPEYLLDPLRKIQDDVSKLSNNERHPERAVVGAILDARLSELVTQGVGAPHGAASETRIEFHLTVANVLARARRYGDAVRILREVLVTRMVIAQGGATGWLEPRQRRNAETRLLRSRGVADLWKEVAGLRNKASHANLDLEAARNELDEVVEAFESPSLVERVRAACEDTALWTEQPVCGRPVVWMRSPDAPDAPLEVRQVWTHMLMRVEDGTDKIDGKLRPQYTIDGEQRPQPSKKARRNRDIPLLEEGRYLDRERLLPSSSWVREQVDEDRLDLRGVSHVVFSGEGHPSSRATYVRALLWRGVLPWQWMPGPGAAADDELHRFWGRLYPLFDRDTVLRVRPDLLSSRK